MSEGFSFNLDDTTVDQLRGFRKAPLSSPIELEKIATRGPDTTRIQRTTGSRGDHQPLGVIELPSTRAARAEPTTPSMRCAGDDDGGCDQDDG